MFTCQGTVHPSTNYWEKCFKKCILVLHPSLLPSDVSLRQFSSRGTESLSVIRSVVMPSIQTKTLAKTPYLCLISYHGLISSTLIATVVLQVYFSACKLFSCSYVQGGLKNGVYNQFRRNVTSRCYNLSDQTWQETYVRFLEILLLHIKYFTHNDIHDVDY